MNTAAPRGEGGSRRHQVQHTASLHDQSQCKTSCRQRPGRGPCACDRPNRSAAGRVRANGSDRGRSVSRSRRSGASLHGLLTLQGKDLDLAAATLDLLLTCFINAYNYARRLKTLKGLTPYEYICKISTSEHARFTLNPTHKSNPSNPGIKHRQYMGTLKSACLSGKHGPGKCTTFTEAISIPRGCFHRGK